MKFKNPLLVVVNIEKSVEFYKNVLGLKKTADFGNCGASVLSEWL